MADNQAKEYRPDEFDCVASEEAGHLGQGSFGTVRLAFHKVLDAVAIKCFPLKNSADENVVKEELTILHSINHPNVLRVFGWTKWQCSIGIVMQYLPGGNLGTLLENENVALSIPLRLRFCCEVADGLSFLHNIDDKKKLTHGDMKPENVILTKDLHCKIADFGGAKISTCSSYPQQMRITANPSPLTVFFAAPERLANPFLQLHPNQDVYSFAIITHMVLTRKFCLPVNVSPELFTNAVNNGKRPDTADIEDLVSQLESNNQTKDVQTVNTLRKEMIKSWNGDSRLRPTMIEIKNELMKKFNSYEFHSILVDVAKVLNALTTPSTSNSRNRCVSLSKLLPPCFQTTTDSGFYNSTNSMETGSVRENDLAQQFIKMLLSGLTERQKSIKSDLSKMSVMLQTSKLSEAEKTCKEVIRKIKSNPPNPESCKDVVCDLIEAAGKCAQKLQFGSCPALLAVAIELCGRIPDSEEKLKSLNSCGDALEDAVIIMYKKDLERLIRAVAIPLLQTILVAVKSVHGASTSVKAQAESLCLYYLGRAYIYLSEHSHAAKALNSGIILRVKEFGESASKLAAFGRFFTLLASAEKGLGQIKDAEKSLQAARSSFEKAIDLSQQSKRDILKAIDEEIEQLRNATTEISMESLAALLLLL